MAPNSRANTPILFGFAAIYLIWGSTYLALALALQTMPPFALMGTRSIAGGLLLLAYSRITGGDRGSAKSWLRASVCGILFFVGCHGILAYAEQRVPSGLAALLLATIPFWILGVRSILGRSDEPLARTMLFLLPGLGGVVLVAWRSIEGPTALQVSDILLLLAASASWALGTIIAEGHKDSASSVVLSGRELVAGGMVLLLLSAWRGEPANIDLSAISLTSLAGWCYLTLAGTVVAFGSYIWLLKRVSPTLVATYTFVNPAIAVLLVGLGVPWRKTHGHHGNRRPAGHRIGGRFAGRKSQLETRGDEIMVEAKAHTAGGRKTVKIGVVAPLSGMGAKLGLEMAQAVGLAIDDANANRAGSSFDFELVRYDDKGEESEGNRVAVALIEDNDVMGVVGHYNSNVTLAVAQTYCDASMPLVSPIVSNPKLTERGWSNVFRFTNRDDATAAVLANHLSGH